jgi:hypothetical protein
MAAAAASPSPSRIAAIMAANPSSTMRRMSALSSVSARVRRM